MGNNNSQQQQDNLYLSGSQLLLTSHKFLSYQSEIVYHRKFAPNIQSQYIITNKIMNRDDENIKIYFEKLVNYEKIMRHNNLFIPLMCIQQKINDQCSFCSIFNNNNVKMKFCYQDFSIPLSKELHLRRSKGYKFNQTQIWYIIYHILLAIKQFQRFSQKSGILNINQVFMNKKGDISIKNQLYSPNYQEEQQSIDCYSPQQIDIMAKNYRTIQKIDDKVYTFHKIIPNICQTFSLGIIVISLTSLFDHDDFYDYQDMNLNVHIIQEAIKRTHSSGYSKLMINFIRVLLSRYKDRPLPSQLYNFLQPYKRSILNFMPFNIRQIHKSMIF